MEKKEFLERLCIQSVLLRMSFIACCLMISWQVASQGLDALSNPQITVNLTHPPGLGLKINKVVFNPTGGECADEVTDAIISLFVQNNVEVIDRTNLNALLAEHDLSLSGYVDKTSAAQIGKIIGPSAMVNVKVLRCQTEINDKLYSDEKLYNYATKSYYMARAYIARTSVFLKVSVQTTDLTTGRIFTAKTFEYSPVKEVKSYEGRPEAPSEFDVRDFALKNLTRDVHKLFFTWNESVLLYFFDDKDGGLKEAFKALKGGDFKNAYDLSVSNLEICKNNPDIKPKILSHAYYNLGMMHFIRNEYEKAIPLFEESQKLRPGNIVTDAIKKCQLANSLAAEMQRVDEKAELDIAKSNEQTQLAKKAEEKSVLTNVDVINLIEKKLPNSLIIQKIKTSKCNFDTSADELIKLTTAGVPEEVLLIMMEQKN